MRKRISIWLHWIADRIDKPIERNFDLTPEEAVYALQQAENRKQALKAKT